MPRGRDLRLLLSLRLCVAFLRKCLGAAMAEDVETSAPEAARNLVLRCKQARKLHAKTAQARYKRECRRTASGNRVWLPGSKGATVVMGAGSRWRVGAPIDVGRGNTGIVDGAVAQRRRQVGPR